MKQYTYVSSRGENIYHRYYDSSGKMVQEITQNKPYYYLHSNSGTIKDIYGKFVERYDFETVKDYRNNRQMMVNSGVEVLGMDNLDILAISDLYPKKINYDFSLLRIASIDIETVSKNGFPYAHLAEQEIDAISHIDSYTGNIEFFSTRLWNKKISSLPKDILKRVNYRYFDNERDMLISYLQYWSKNYPDIVTGWNIDNYDIPYLINRYDNVFGRKVTNKFSPFGIITSQNSEDKENEIFNIAGISCLDYLNLYKKFRLINRSSYKLDYIAELELGENKLDYEGPLWKLAEEDSQRYGDYNIQDTLLIEKMERKMKYISLACSICYYAKINFEKIYSAVNIWDSILYNSLKSKNIVVPMKRKQSKEFAYEGAYVKEPKLGKRYGWIASFDATSLYPSIIRQWNISPETIMGQIKGYTVDDYLNKRVKISNQYGQAANGSIYDNSKRGVVPDEIEKVFFQRKHHKSNDFFAKKVGEVFQLCITLYDKLPKDLKLDSFKYIGLSEKDLESLIDSYDKNKKEEEYKLLESDLQELHKYIQE